MKIEFHRQTFMTFCNMTLAVGFFHPTLLGNLIICSNNLLCVHFTCASLFSKCPSVFAPFKILPILWSSWSSRKALLLSSVISIGSDHSSANFALTCITYMAFIPHLECGLLFTNHFTVYAHLILINHTGIGDTRSPSISRILFIFKTWNSVPIKE